MKNGIIARFLKFYAGVTINCKLILPKYRNYNTINADAQGGGWETTLPLWSGLI